MRDHSVQILVTLLLFRDSIRSEFFQCQFSSFSRFLVINAQNESKNITRLFTVVYGLVSLCCTSTCFLRLTTINNKTFFFLNTPIYFNRGRILYYTIALYTTVICWYVRTNSENMWFFKIKFKRQQAYVLYSYLA